VSIPADTGTAENPWCLQFWKVSIFPDGLFAVARKKKQALRLARRLTG